MIPRSLFQPPVFLSFVTGCCVLNYPHTPPHTLHLAHPTLYPAPCSTSVFWIVYLRPIYDRRNKHVNRKISIRKYRDKQTEKKICLLYFLLMWLILAFLFPKWGCVGPRRAKLAAVDNPPLLLVTTLNQLTDQVEFTVISWEHLVKYLQQHTVTTAAPGSAQQPTYLK